MADNVDKSKIIEQLAGYDFIRFTYTDFHGTSRSKIQPAKNAYKVLDSGIGVNFCEYYHFCRFVSENAPSAQSAKGHRLTLSWSVIIRSLGSVG